MKNIKRLVSLLLTLTLIGCALPLTFAAEEKNEIVIDSSWSILIPVSATKRQKYAADKFSEKLSEVLSCTVPVVTSATDKFIAIDSEDGADVSSVKENGYIIKADKNIYINGTGKRGALYGAYRFLEEYCGLKVYTEDITILPKTDKISVPADAYIKYEPFFEYTITDWKSVSDMEYGITNGLSGGKYPELNEKSGGAVSYLGAFCHTLTGQFCSAQKYFDTHPEYFAYRDGKRIKDQLCLTNPGTLEVIKGEVMELLKNGHDPEATLQMISLTQADNYNYCMCDNCEKFAREHGNAQSAMMVNMVNQVADMVKAAGYENVAIDTFAYQYTRHAPTGIIPRDNVIIRICTIESCYAHSIDDPDCPQNIGMMNDINDWSKICKRIYIWGYTTNYAHTCCVFPNFGVIQKNIQMYYEHNVKGVYEEGNHYIDTCDVEFGELRLYMISRCLQNPYCDLDEEMNGFLEAYYGPGGKYIRKAIDMFTKCAGDRKGYIWIYQPSKTSLHMNGFQVKKVDGYFESAKKEAQTEEQLKNILRSEISWRYYKATAIKGEFSYFNPERFDKLEELYNDIRNAGVTKMCEWDTVGNYFDCTAVRYLSPDDWSYYEPGASKQADRQVKMEQAREKVTPFLTAYGIMYDMLQVFYKLGNNLFGKAC